MATRGKDTVELSRDKFRGAVTGAEDGAAGPCRLGEVNDGECVE